MAYINGNQVLFSAQFNGLVTIDEEMSDTSENPVQNKIVKQYIDAHSGGSGGGGSGDIIPEVEDYIKSIMFMELPSDYEGEQIEGIASPSAVVNYVHDYAGGIAEQKVKDLTLNGLLPEMAGGNMTNIPTTAAVVDYVNGYAELKKEWEVIPVAVNELSEDAAQWETQVELYGNTKKGVRVMLLLPPNTTLPNNRATMTVALNKLDGINRIMTVRAEGWKINEAQTVCVFDIVPRAGVWNVEVTPYQKTVDTVQGSMLYDSGDKVRYVTFKANDTNKLPAGTSINVWGLK